MKGLWRGCLVGTWIVAGCVAWGYAVSFPASPSAVYAASHQEGAQLFVQSGCTQCHGDSGLGTGKGPSLRDVRKRLTGPQILRQIKEGGKSMPPFGDALTDPQIEQLMEFLRSRGAWKQRPPPVTSNPSASSAANP